MPSGTPRVWQDFRMAILYFSSDRARRFAATPPGSMKRVAEVISFFSEATLRQGTEKTYQLMAAMCLMPTPHATFDLPESEWNAVLHMLTPHEKFKFGKDLKLSWRHAITAATSLQFPRDLRELPQDPTVLHSMRPDLSNALFMPSGMLVHCPWGPVRLKQMAESVPMRSTHRTLKVHSRTAVLDAMHATVPAAVAMHGAAADAMHCPVLATADAMHGPIPAAADAIHVPVPAAGVAMHGAAADAMHGPVPAAADAIQGGIERKEHGDEPHIEILSRAPPEPAAQLAVLALRR